MYVNLSGRRFYLGKAGTDGIEEAYNRLLARWKAGGRRPLVDASDVTVTEVSARFLAHAEVYYSRRELKNWPPVLRAVKRLFGGTPAGQFDALALRAVRDEFIRAGGCRPYVNAQTTKVKRLFRWAVGEGLIDGGKLAGLLAVPNLQRGRTEVPEPEPLQPVPRSHIAATRRALSETVRTMIDVQLLTACRPGELTALRAVDIDVSGPVWVYAPPAHKNAWRGTRRRLFIGPKAQRLLRPRMAGRPVHGYLFPPGDDSETMYSRCGYATAVKRACDRAGVPRWSPGQLRHNAATRLRRLHDAETTRILLGHSGLDATEIYAEQDDRRAVATARRIG